MYVLLRGRLAAVATDRQGKERTLNEIARGECVGEMGLLTDQPRSTAVRAVRDSRLVSFSKESFERVRAAYPQALVGVTRVLVDRLTRATAASGIVAVGSGIRTIAVVPAQADDPAEEFVTGLVGALAARGPTLRLSRARVDRHFGGNAELSAADDGPAGMRLAAWLDDQELKHRFVVYETDTDATDWTSRCLRQADEVVVVTPVDRLPEIERLGALLESQKRSDVASRTTLVVIHEDDRRAERLARLADGRALGLVLGGGGARAFAQIGVLRALEEAGIAVDMIGGTSVGALLAAMYAMGMPPEEMIEASRRAFLKEKPHRDLTLPIFGLLSGRRGDRIQHRVFGDREIEDLWINYFAISANLTTARQVVHSRGTVCSALRASMAVPGAIVPAVSGHDLLVDGGVLNSLRSDVMRRFCGGQVSAVDVSPATELSVATDDEQLPSPWKVLWSRVSPFRSPMKVPNFMAILTRSSTLASVQNERAARHQADLYLKPPVDRFGIYEMAAIDEIVDIGYRYGRDELAEWRPDDPS
jgi:NTE family protein/lysophospholipid hydrolase